MESSNPRSIKITNLPQGDDKQIYRFIKLCLIYSWGLNTATQFLETLNYRTLSLAIRLWPGQWNKIVHVPNYGPLGYRTEGFDLNTGLVHFSNTHCTVRMLNQPSECQTFWRLVFERLMVHFLLFNFWLV